ncbi:expressed unknown protein [Seminavis robusta]|uniref:Uncharacterized protein n=1 Tax=Seminavis robusta TaxID=568900 RepID=A0A9N8HSH7_9STRA|nr:expressed unknown protein [Seminavis robusta]|eukprot:Sro1445_g273360.1 n/a (337) ;mRNA; f:5159-6292
MDRTNTTESHNGSERDLQKNSPNQEGTDDNNNEVPVRGTDENQRDDEGDEGGDEEAATGDQDQEVQPLLPHSVTVQADPKFMEISDQEREWALAIKRAVEASPELDSIPDMMCAHLAIFSQGDLDCAVNRVFNLQAYRKEYNIVNSIEEGKRVIEKYNFVDFQGIVLSFDFDLEIGNSLVVLDITKLDKGVFKCHRKTKEIFMALYYGSQAYFPNLEVVRKGNVQIAEFEGFDPSKNMVDGKIFRRGLIEIHGSYPTVVSHLYMYHTPMVANLMVSLGKRVLPKNLFPKITMGCTFPGRLDQFYGLPTIEAATRRALDNLYESLRIRYENERTFRL